MNDLNKKELLCIFILSVKSSGSSILQRYIANNYAAKLLSKTPHYENETLYWTKAASILGLPQFKMPNSEVPISATRAKKMLRSLLEDNAPTYKGPIETEVDFFRAWTVLVSLSPGIFLEKSPHHLYQPSVLELMERYADQSAVPIRFIGLIRNPTDTLYSSWRRFGIRPEIEEKHWVRAYSQLHHFQSRRPELVSIVRYEDLVNGTVDVQALIGTQAITQSAQLSAETFRNTSIQKWRKDSHFRFSPHAQTLALAREYGFRDDEMINENAGYWLHYEIPRAIAYKLFSMIPRSLERKLRLTARKFL